MTYYIQYFFLFISCVCILLYSLKYLFNKRRDTTYTIMLGLVIGSIEKVWPWNKSFSTELSNLNLFLSISLVILGFIIVILLERIKKIK